MTHITTIVLALVFVLGQAGAPQQPIGTLKGTYQRIIVRGASLEGSLSKDSPDREVSVYLPPGYSSSERRYPVVYLLHGFTDSDAQWFGLRKHFVHVPAAADAAAAAGAKDMILVMPNAFTMTGSLQPSSGGRAPASCSTIRTTGGGPCP